MATPKNVHDCDLVETAADFVAYLALLAEDIEPQEQARHAAIAAGTYVAYLDDDPNDGWKNPTVSSFLDAWASWLATRSQLDPRWERHDTVAPSWRALAQQLSAARTYE
ncbi:DUF7660 family protein [Crossiella cryophila]|uniref:DUF7660 domain-containing protein n=1 Tax=Crossiella cryophila TaxID=43355 RepID=A0A7W7FUD9_9PSEU|nr:hypothetical protein [Crossiella cryophila]MBB4679206.1 hypothetical protein [Crossiella cryophila]